ncbi:MAG: P-type conjugative transfer protein TrbG [Endozoicomonas sp. (ex Botrylloides leachii)]|nr:P-type conjugative transfer protein TrbG [Endozoicomonas sp. (ex Botrylloides leachii)]
MVKAGLIPQGIAMKKQLLVFMLSVFPSFNLLATSNFERSYFSGKEPKLTTQEKEAIIQYHQWQKRVNEKNNKPIIGKDGIIRYIYGVQQATIICAPFKVCNLQLQPGETLSDTPEVGDTARWTIKPSIAGDTINVNFKPHDVGLETSMVITTNRRTYNIVAKSDQKDWMPKVGFIYPEQEEAKWAAIEQQQAKKRQQATLPQTHEYLGNLDFKYFIKGNASWKPVRVYNDGQKTIIQMPSILHQKDAPALMVVTKERGLFSKAQLAMVNYRVQNDRYIVDSVFDEAILISGVGNHQQKVTIKRGSS